MRNGKVHVLSPTPRAINSVQTCLRYAFGPSQKIPCSSICGKKQISFVKKIQKIAVLVFDRTHLENHLQDKDDETEYVRCIGYGCTHCSIHHQKCRKFVYRRLSQTKSRSKLSISHVLKIDPRTWVVAQNHTCTKLGSIEVRLVCLIKVGFYRSETNLANQNWAISFG
jgi:uncharacterized protein YebE (UPF0316 family)